jgi:hypothetical protein
MALPGSLKGIGEDRVGSGRQDDEAAERDAIQHEARYATRQTIPQELMMRGLIEGAKASYSKPHSAHLNTFSRPVAHHGAVRWRASEGHAVSFENDNLSF